MLMRSVLNIVCAFIAAVVGIAIRIPPRVLARFERICAVVMTREPDAKAMLCNCLSPPVIIRALPPGSAYSLRSDSSAPPPYQLSILIESMTITLTPWTINEAAASNKASLVNGCADKQLPIGPATRIQLRSTEPSGHMYATYSPLREASRRKLEARVVLPLAGGPVMIHSPGWTPPERRASNLGTPVVKFT